MEDGDIPSLLAMPSLLGYRSITKQIRGSALQLSPVLHYQERLGYTRRLLDEGNSIVSLTVGPSSLPALVRYSHYITPTEGIFLFHSADPEGHLHLCRRLLSRPGGQA